MLTTISYGTGFFYFLHWTCCKIKTLDIKTVFKKVEGTVCIDIRLSGH